MTSIETWVSHITPESQQQSIKWFIHEIYYKTNERPQFQYEISCALYSGIGKELVDYLPRNETVNAQ